MEEGECYYLCTKSDSTLVRKGGRWLSGKEACMIPIDFKDAIPIYEQVVERFKELILKGVITADEKIPSVRNLAVDLSINPNTIQRAYAELERQGYIYTVKGKGNFASERTKLLPKYKKELIGQLKELCKAATAVGMTEEEIIREIRELEKYD